MKNTLEYIFSLSLAKAAEIFEDICRKQYSGDEYNEHYQFVDSLPERVYPDGKSERLSEVDRIEIVAGYLGAHSGTLEKVHFAVIWLARKEFTDPSAIQAAQAIRESSLMALTVALSRSYKAVIEKRAMRN